MIAEVAAVIVVVGLALIARVVCSKGHDKDADARFDEENKIRHDEIMRIADEEMVSEDTQPIQNVKVFRPKYFPPDGPPRELP